ncbi:hypothetical protein LZ30DRAFT_104124 [Colletotrichum cereale]|nr:hypothetical protein LZ30DRAFT_104124 [Colletotrichum cereale]
MGSCKSPSPLRLRPPAHSLRLPVLHRVHHHAQNGLGTVGSRGLVAVTSVVFNLSMQRPVPLPQSIGQEKAAKGRNGGGERNPCRIVGIQSARVWLSPRPYTAPISRWPTRLSGKPSFDSTAPRRSTAGILERAFERRRYFYSLCLPVLSLSLSLSLSRARARLVDGALPRLC